VTIIVAVFLLLVLALLIALTWGLMGMAKGNGKLVIKTTTAAIPPKIVFHIEYTPPDRPPVGSPDAPFNGADSPEELSSGEDPPELPGGQDPEEPGSGGDSDST
jgi:hypothetical protein